MYGFNFLSIYEQLQHLGLVESERSFSCWLDRAPQYLRDHRKAGDSRVSAATVAMLRRRLLGVAQMAPPGVAHDLRAIVERVDRATAVYATLAR